MSLLRAIVAKVSSATQLSRDEARLAVGVMMEGKASAVEIAAILTAMRVRSETADEIAGAVQIMRERMLVVPLDDAMRAVVIDIVGTGGDGKNSYNTSTASCLVAAAAGAKVAKHGARSASSMSGAADVLEALGVDINLPADSVAAALDDFGFAFMFAPNYHAAMRHVGPVRKELGFPTLFNYCGPLSNPARVRRLLLGVNSPERVNLMASALASSNVDCAWVVHGNGYDELTVQGVNKIAQVKGNSITEFELDASDIGFKPIDLNDLTGGDPRENADAIVRVMAREPSAFAETVILNSGAALVVSGMVDDIRAGVDLARASIESGAASRLLASLRG